MLFIIYKSILYLLTWNYSPDITTLQILDHQIKNLLRNRFAHFYHNPLLDQFQVGKKKKLIKIFLFFSLDFYGE